MREYFGKIEHATRYALPQVEDERIARLTSITRALESDTANPKHERKHKRRVVKGVSGFRTTEHWVHSQELLKTQRSKCVFNVSKNPFERECQRAEVKEPKKPLAPSDNPESTWQTLETTNNSQFEATLRNEGNPRQESHIPEGDIFGFSSINHNEALS